MLTAKDAAYLNRLANAGSIAAKTAPVDARLAALALYVNAGNNSRAEKVGATEIVYSASNAAARGIELHASRLGLAVGYAPGGIVTHPNYRAFA